MKYFDNIFVQIEAFSKHPEEICADCVKQKQNDWNAKPLGKKIDFS